MKSILRLTALVAAIMTVGGTMVGCGANKVTESSSLIDSNNSSQVEASGEDVSSSDETSSDTVSSGESSTATTTKQDAVNSGKPSSGTKPVNKNFVEPVYDLGGRVIKIAWERKAIDEKSDDTILFNSIKETEKKFNCTFKFVQKSDYFGLYESIILESNAKKATYDAYVLRGYDVLPNMANTGAILKMEEYYDFANDPAWQKKQVKDIGWFKGHKYGLAWEPNEIGHGLWYNRALLAQAGIPDLWTYVNNNTWNWDTFRRISKQFMQKKGDSNGDGRRDHYAFTAEDPWLTFVYTNNASLVKVGADGKAVLNLDSKNALDALTLIEQMHNVDHSIPDGKELGQITNSPFNAMFTGKVAMFPYHARYGAVLEAQKINDFGWIYLPKGPAATDYVTPTGSMPDMAMFPTYVKQPKEVIAAVQDALAYWDTSKKNPVVIEKKTEWLYNALKTSIKGDSFKVLKKQALEPVFTWSNNYNLEELQTLLWPKILESKNVKSSVDSLKKTLQTKLDQKYSGTVVG